MVIGQKPPCRHVSPIPFACCLPVIAAPRVGSRILQRIRFVVSVTPNIDLSTGCVQQRARSARGFGIALAWFQSRCNVVSESASPHPALE
ncbi:hypothetical protein Ga0080574_TMP4894 (plasmid) [Salipiger abyssi]|uniref:Uncharacterized protein n=1 Tax=Salipiger abyssi TaxID=1250539 RepID=A0A1P8V0P0_9RHOB|nr:hypothetical protein Ga0080574_TMP4894 [Salipiger abyssi]